MFYQIFLSPQVKRWAIITYKHGIYDAIHSLYDPRKLRNISRVCKLHRLKPSAHSSCQNGSFVNTSKRFLKNRN